MRSGFCSLQSGKYIMTYCGWKISCTTLDGWNPVNNGIDHHRGTIFSIKHLRILEHIPTRSNV